MLLLVRIINSTIAYTHHLFCVVRSGAIIFCRRGGSFDQVTLAIDTALPGRKPSTSAD